jgi:hypothetical protein
MKEKIKKSQYESTKKYTIEYNKSNINVQLDRNLINTIKEKLDNKISVKSYIENLIRKDFNI